jgi:uncharacterized protein (DUF1786 family)
VAKYFVVTDGKVAVTALDDERRARKMTKLAASAREKDTGQQYNRMLKRNDVRLSAFIRYLDVIGYDMVLVERRPGT